MTYFLDTNIISYLLGGDETISKKLLEVIDDGGVIKIPVVACYEIKRGLYRATGKNKIKHFQEILGQLDIEGMSINAFMVAAQIYEDLAKQGNVIEDDDIFIGASALEHNAVLVTNNERHLGRIKDLRIEVWKV